MFKVNNRNTRKRYEICSKLIIKTAERSLTCSRSIIKALEKGEIFSKLTRKTPELRQGRFAVFFIIKFEHISYLFLVFILLTLNK